MRNKLIFIVFLFSAFAFLFLLVPDIAAYQCYDPSDFHCKNAGSRPSPVCCTSDSCKCGSSTIIRKWHYCYVDKCCLIKGAWVWLWHITQCSTADTCKGDCYLYPGICSDSGCAVGREYKICCKPDGSCCTCSGGNNSGTCPSGC